MNAAAHFLLALLIMALLAGILLGTRRLTGTGGPGAVNDPGSRCAGCDCHRAASTHPATDS